MECDRMYTRGHRIGNVEISVYETETEEDIGTSGHVHVVIV